MKNSLPCFKAYDIRGKVPDELNEDLAYKIGKAYAAEFNPKRVAVGFDIRLESESLANAVKKGLTEAGVDVFDIGLCGTEEIYFATFYNHLDGGIMITASHNPKAYNGMKLVTRDAKPISGDFGLREIEQRVINDDFGTEKQFNSGHIELHTSKKAYIEHLLSYIGINNLKPFTVVMNAGNGSAGVVIREIAEHLPFNCVFVQETPDGNFPYGVPNPLLPENRATTSAAVIAHKADFGIAWDGDFDRCFLFDEHGEFIEGYYLVGLLAKTLLAKYPGGKIIHDPRLTWNTIEQVKLNGGIPVQSKTGHAFIKDTMRAEDAIYGGEMSAHHYFKDFAYCDSGMIPWLLVAELMSKTGLPLSALVKECMAAYPCSGELNYVVDNAPQILERIIAFYEPQSPGCDKTDGISLEFAQWRMNIRLSNTEPLLRLNVESRGDATLVKTKVKELEALILGSVA